MISLRYPRRTRQAFSGAISGTRAVTCPVAVLLIVIGLQGAALGQSDDFNDGDDIGWVHFDPGTSTYSFPDDRFAGKAYRILSSVPGNTNLGPARAFSYRTNQYDNFYVAVDVVAWDRSLNQAFGLVTRAGSIGAGQTTGYVLDYAPNRQAGGRGRLQIDAITNEQPTPLVAANITFDPTHRYRFVMNGFASTLIGEIYDYSDLTTALVRISADDTAYSSGVIGVFSSSGFGAQDPTNSVAGPADVTFDNYGASTAPPDIFGTPHPIPGMPQVVNRVPQARANFYSYGNGIRFTATTLTTNPINTNAIKLYLNGADVSSGLTLSGTSSNLDVAFNGLASNTAYDARVVLSDFSGRSSTNEFTFDTFDEGYFDSPAVKVIEAEDYNYSSGEFQDNPPPSGVDIDGFQINGFGVGYYGLMGEPGVDFFDHSTNAGSGAAAEYRPVDPVWTQAGSAQEIDNAGGQNDTIRAKYITSGFVLPEYEVRGTEGGEWLNYTRVFSNASYHVYLREACRAAQAVYLDRVTSDPARPNQATARLGVFNVPSTAMLINYRYVPLADTNGNPAALDLSGTNTLRLTLGGAKADATQYTMVLNYLLFIPITVQQMVLESSPDAAGIFATENAATIDPAARTITVPRNGNIRFYRIQSSAPPALSITSVRLDGANMVMDYR
jgi:hypothetical protein